MLLTAGHEQNDYEDNDLVACVFIYLHPIMFLFHYQLAFSQHWSDLVAVKRGLYLKLVVDLGL